MLACSLFVRPIDFMNYKGAIYDGKLNSVNTLEETSIKYHHFVVIFKNLRERHLSSGQFGIHLLNAY